MRWLGCVVALGVTGCTGYAHDYRPKPVPTYQETAAPSTGRPQLVDLQTALRESLQAPAVTSATTERIAQVRGDLVTASLAPNPTIALTTSLQAWPGQNWSPTRQGGPPQYDALLSQPIDAFIFGKRAAAQETARRALDVAAADAADYRRQRAAVTADAFYGLLVAKEEAKLTAETVSQLERVEKLIEGRVTSGDTPIIDLDRARLNTRIARRQAREAEVNVAQARAILQALMGRTDGQFDLSGTLETNETPEPPTVEAALDRAVQQRPDLEAARREVQHAEADLVAQHRNGLPTLALQIGATHQSQHVIGQRDANSMGGGIVVSLPTFDRNQGNVEVAESKVRSAQLTLDATLTSVRSELQQSVAAYTQARQSVLIDSQESVTAALDVRDRVEKSYKEGGSSLLQLLDAQRAYQEALFARIEILESFWHTRFALESAMGTDFTQ